MPIQYAPGILEEHLTTRKRAGLFDISHMGRFRIRGRDALPFVQHVLTNDATSLEPNRAQYTTIPNEDGGAIDDVYLYRFGEEDFRLVVNAANTEKDFEWLNARKGGFREVILEDETDSIAMFSFQGPKSRHILENVLGGAKGRLPAQKRNHFETLEIDGFPVTVSCTGYTGEPIGFEIFSSSASAVSLWTEILERGEPEKLLPIGLGARDTLRLEAGFPLYGHELGLDPLGKIIPLFALPLARFAVSLSPDKGDFVGRKIFERQHRETALWRKGELSLPLEERVVPKRIFPVAVTGRGVARQGYEIYQGDTLKGHVTSGTVVPYWIFQGDGPTSTPGEEKGRRAIALAYLDSDVSEGQPLVVTDGRRSFEAVVAKAPLKTNAPPYARPVLYS